MEMRNSETELPSTDEEKLAWQRRIRELAEECAKVCGSYFAAAQFQEWAFKLVKRRPENGD
jgi:hypothetical protein